MLTTKQFNDRCDRLFGNMKTRFGARYFKSGKRQGMLKTPARDLPFDRYDMRTFMAKQVGLNAIPCPYCGCAIDILSLTLDHVTPASRGGGLGFDNLGPCCDSCNREKGELTGDEFIDLHEFLRTMPPLAQRDIQKRLRGSGRFMPKYEKKDPNAVAPSRVPRYHPPQMQLEESF